MGIDEQSTVAMQRLDASPPPEASFVLRVLEGPDRGLTLRIDGSEPARVLVGKSPACGLRLTDAQVSRRHAALEAVERRLRLSDLGSKNGTFVDGERIDSPSQVPMGVPVKVGATTFELRG